MPEPRGEEELGAGLDIHCKDQLNGEFAAHPSYGCGHRVGSCMILKGLHPSGSLISDRNHSHPLAGMISGYSVLCLVVRVMDRIPQEGHTPSPVMCPEKGHNSDC